MPFISTAMYVAAHLMQQPQPQAQPKAPALSPPQVVAIVNSMPPTALSQTPVPVETLINGQPYVMTSTTTPPSPADTSSTGQPNPGSPATTPTPAPTLASASSSSEIPAALSAPAQGVVTGVIAPRLVTPTAIAGATPPIEPSATTIAPSNQLLTPSSTSQLSDPLTPVIANDVAPLAASTATNQAVPAIPELPTWTLMLIGFVLSWLLVKKERVEL